MKLLIITQVVDTEDPVLGFFVRWIEELSKQVEYVHVICLKEGKHTLPANVQVHSLGKECGATSRIMYMFRFLSLVWKLRSDYEAVFVHMNQEYILIAGWLWRLLGKRVYLWRNHYAGSWLTDLAAAFCTKIFCTSKRSYTAKYKKTVLMPVGVDTKRFFPDASVVRQKCSILFLSRMSPSKRPEMLMDALAILAHDGVECTADFYGSPLPCDEVFYEELKEKVHALSLESRVTFYPGPPNYQAPDIFRMHEIFVNCSPSGMLDKTIFEAAASGCVVFASSDDFAECVGMNFHFSSGAELADLLNEYRRNAVSISGLIELARNNSLSALNERFHEEMQV